MPRLGLNEEEGLTGQVRSMGNNLDERVPRFRRLLRDLGAGWIEGELLSEVDG